MPTFIYNARDKEGKKISGLVEAPNQKVAANLLREKHFVIINLSQRSEKITLERLFKKFRKISLNEKANFTRQFSTLISSGLSIPEALSIIRSQTENSRMINLLLDIENTITSGGTLANAFEKHSDVFSKTYVALIKAGEASGELDKVLNRLAETQEKEREFKAKVKSAMIYPIIIIIGMVIVIFIMITFVIPKLTEMYNDFGLSLPFTTQILISISNFFSSYWWIIIFLFFGLGYFLIKWKKTPVGEIIIDQISLKIPVFGNLQRMILLTEFSRTFGMLMNSGIHVLDGLSFLEGSIGNSLYRRALSEISKKIEKGFSMGETFAQYTTLFPTIVSQMIKVGEETGKLDETLDKLSTYFEKESEYMVKNLTTVIEPVIMVILGLGVGFIVFSIITPIYSLTSQIR
ncbi:MAG: type II secretion system F family protein [Patescibacteria group bacterium]|nr:type II secretion system F family protein [Patescibacteria group bacterium]